MNFSEETKEDFRRLREQFQRWCEQKWQDDLFDFQMSHNLTDKAIQELDES